MKKIFFVAPLTVLLLSSCRDKQIWCESIGQNIKNWSVYDLNDSISMHDQFGNAVSYQITKYDNSPGYQTIQRGGWMKKMVDCQGSLSLADNTNYFNLYIEGTSGETDENRKPDYFGFTVRVGDLIGNFAVSGSDASTQTLYPSDGSSTLEQNYSSGNEVYEQVFVSEVDTLVNPTASVYRFVYAKNKGLVEYSTRNPARTYILD